MAVPQEPSHKTTRIRVRLPVAPDARARLLPNVPALPTRLGTARARTRAFYGELYTNLMYLAPSKVPPPRGVEGPLAEPVLDALTAPNYPHTRNVGSAGR